MDVRFLHSASGSEVVSGRVQWQVFSKPGRYATAAGTNSIIPMSVQPMAMARNVQGSMPKSQARISDVTPCR